jgi:Zn-dependent protease
MLIKTKKTGFNISKKEIKDLTKAWIILSLAFAIYFMNGLFLNFEFLLAFLVAAITVGTAFIFHELGHKIMAQHYGCFAEFRSFDNMLFLALIASFFGFIFAAPGAVMISGPVGIKRNGKISALGPGINMILAIIFLILHFNIQYPSLNIITYYGFLINSWLALFNLIPLTMFDGKKILQWNKFVYGLMVFVALILMIFQSFVRI